MPIQFTPDVARLAPATRLTRRGESPTVMVEQDHDLLKQCPWLDTTAGVNPGGTEVGISEEIVEFMLLNFAKLVEPMVTGGRRQHTIMQDALLPDTLERLYTGAVKMGWDKTTVFTSMGEFLKEARQWVEENDPDDAGPVDVL